MSTINNANIDIALGKLAVELVNKDVVIVIGPDLAASEALLPSTKKLSKEMAGRCNYTGPHVENFQYTANYYEAVLGRHSLTQFILDQMVIPTEFSSTLYKNIVRLFCPAIVCTAYDRLLESTFEKMPKAEYRRVIRETDIPYHEWGKTLLIKLRGTVDQPDSLILTEDDHALMFTQLPMLSVIVHSYFAAKTLLFVGFDLNSDLFRNFYSQMLHLVDRHSRQAYAIFLDPSPELQMIWSRRRLTILSLTPQFAISELLKQSETLRRQSNLSAMKATLKQPKQPYKFLDYFTPDDRGIFFGRIAESFHLTQQITAHNLTVLVGNSGVGKTSLVNAGATPLLREEGYSTLYIRCLDEPSKVIKSSVWLLVQKGNPIPLNYEKQKLRQFLEQTLPVGERLVIFLDQFEEYFIRIGDASRELFANQLADCLKNNTLDVRFVIIIRGDYFHRLDEMEPPISSVYANRLHLHNLDFGQAQQAIMGPARLFEIQIEEKLLNVLLDDLNTDGIAPPQLQIVCHNLFRTLDSGQHNLTVEAYRQLGGTGGMLSRYVDFVLEELDPSQAEAARIVLKSMVTAEQTKAALHVKEIARDTIVQKVGLATIEVEEVLKLLQDHRLVRGLPIQGVYELAHDVLVEKIWEWVTAEEVRIKYVRQMLQQALGDFRQLGVLLGPEKRNILNKHRTELEFTEEELELALNSAISSGEDIVYWYERARENNVEVHTILEKLMTPSEPEIMQRVLLLFEQVEIDHPFKILHRSLNSGYPALIRHTRRILRGYQQSEAQTLLSSTAPQKYFAFVPDGDFVMGVDKSLIDDEAEQPAHLVNLDPFYIGRHFVTNFEYRLFVRATDNEPPRHWDKNTPFSELADYPVIYVSWFDAFKFCRWLEAETGLPFRLPTEAEWEKAASWDGVSKRTYPWGDTFIANRCNTSESPNVGITPIGMFSPIGGDSYYGVSDLAGNLWDWCQNLLTNEQGKVFQYPYDSNDGREDMSAEGYRALKGGSFFYDRTRARTTCRLRGFAYDRVRYNSFRIALPTNAVDGLNQAEVEKELARVLGEAYY